MVIRKYKYFQELIPTLEKFTSSFGGGIVPCTLQEIDELEFLMPNSYGLPAAYKEFLLFGGKSLGKLYKHKPYMHYDSVKFKLEHKNRDVLKTIRVYNQNAQLYPDMLVFDWHFGAYFDFIRVSEGENPPVYFWSEDEDEDELGLEAVEKLCNSFTDFITFLIRTTAKSCLTRNITKQLDLEQSPRGQQFWLFTPTEQNQGIAYSELMQLMGFVTYQDLDNAASWCGLNSNQYLEELSGWKAIKVGDEVRFFPPSYESHEEKEKKALQLQNQLEEKREELVKVKKRIANYQDRIKNLSSSKLTGTLQFNDILTLKIKELEKELRKPKTLQKNLEKQIAELEKDLNSNSSI